jgi:hypothetical protein
LHKIYPLGPRWPSASCYLIFMIILFLAYDFALKCSKQKPVTIGLKQLWNILLCRIWITGMSYIQIKAHVHWSEVSLIQTPPL